MQSEIQAQVEQAEAELAALKAKASR